MIGKLEVLGEISGACWQDSRNADPLDVIGSWRTAGRELSSAMVTLGENGNSWTTDRGCLISLAAAVVNLILAGDRLDATGTTPAEAHP